MLLVYDVSTWLYDGNENILILFKKNLSPFILNLVKFEMDVNKIEEFWIFIQFNFNVRKKIAFLITKNEQNCALFQFIFVLFCLRFWSLWLASSCICSIVFKWKEIEFHDDTSCNDRSHCIVTKQNKTKKFKYNRIFGVKRNNEGKKGKMKILYFDNKNNHGYLDQNSLKVFFLFFWFKMNSSRNKQTNKKIMIFMNIEIIIKDWWNY